MSKLKLRNTFRLNRMAVVTILLLLQLLWVGVLLQSIYKHYYFVTAISITLKIVFALIIINTTRNPAYKIGWLVLILLFSIFGCLLYLIYGLNISNKKIKRKIEDSTTSLNVLKQDEQTLLTLEKEDEHLKSLSDYLRVMGYPVYTGTKPTFFCCGEEFFPVLLEELKKAEKFIYIETYIIEDGDIWRSVKDVLLEKATSGVKVNIIYDDMGSISKVKKYFYKHVSALHENIDCIKFNKVTPFLDKSINNRDHRKIVVIDGVTAFTGGMNFADEYANITHPFGYWKDHMVMLKGLAVNTFTQMFISMWNAFSTKTLTYEENVQAIDSCGFVQPFSTNPFNKTDIAFHLFLDMIYSSTKSICISSPYLIPDSEIIDALVYSARRGVEVKILSPYIPDKKIAYRLSKANYYQLLKAGVKIYFYKPGFNHAKTIVIDDKIALVGSINLDYRSMFLNFECGTLLYKCEEIKKINKDFEQIFAESVPVGEDYKKTGVFGRFIDNVLRTIEVLF